MTLAINLALSLMLLQADSGGPQSGLFLALDQASKGQCENAIAELNRQFSNRNSADAKTRRISGLALAQCYLSAKQFAPAGKVIDQLQTEFPSDPDVLYTASSYHLKSWNDAIYRLYKSSPSSYRVDQLSAEVFETQGKYTEAIAEYSKAIAKNPRAVNLHFRLGRAILMQSHDPAALEKARREFELELALNPNDAVAEYEIAQILAAEMKHTAAAPHFERAAALRPDFAEALIAVAKLRSEAKNYNEAITLLEKAVKLQPRGEPAHYNLMIAYRNAGRDADARREKDILDRLQRPPDGEFTDFLKRLGEKAPPM